MLTGVKTRVAIKSPVPAAAVPRSATIHFVQAYLTRSTVRCHRIVDELSRRRLLAGGLAAIGMTAAGCSTSDQPSTDSASRTVTTPQGNVIIPGNPQRIVALDAYVALQTLSELGAPVVATGTLGGGVRTLVDSKAQEIPSIGATAADELNFEAVAAARPDLIVGRQPIGEPHYSKLSGIAPTVLVPFVFWRDQYLTVADAINRKPEAERQLSGLNDKIAALRTEIQKAWPAGVRMTVVRVTDTSGDVRSYNTLAASTSFLYADILTQLGIVPTGNTLAGVSPTKVNTAISRERLDELDGDVIVYYVGGGGQANAGTDVEQALTGNALWKKLSAVQKGNAYKVDAAPWFDGYCLRGANAILADLRRVLVDDNN